jgi:indolepyruvate ferredoxin oxidoreductase, beta subunit
LPVAFGQWLLRYEKKGRWVPFMGKGIFVRSNGFFGYYMLRMMAAFRRIRRSSLRYHEEQVEIEAWLACLQTALGKSPGFAQALAELPRVRKGYSDTQARGLKAYRTIVAQIVEPAVQSGKFEGATQRLRRAMAAALADEKHTVLDDLFKLPADA